jgi:hypothetical protein
MSPVDLHFEDLTLARNWLSGGGIQQIDVRRLFPRIQGEGSRSLAAATQRKSSCVADFAFTAEECFARPRGLFRRGNSLRGCGAGSAAKLILF